VYIINARLLKLRQKISIQYESYRSIYKIHTDRKRLIKTIKTTLYKQFHIEFKSSMTKYTTDNLEFCYIALVPISPMLYAPGEHDLYSQLYVEQSQKFLNKLRRKGYCVHKGGVHDNVYCVTWNNIN
jgi:hypothetical protein